MSKIIQKALTKAIELHENQTRKGSDNVPYVVHPVEMAIILSRFTNDEDLIAAALLHDTLEDCEYSKEELIKDFNESIYKFVEMLTEDKLIEDYWERKTKALEKVKGSRTGLAMKAIDATVNMKDTLALIREKGESAWDLFHCTKEMRMNYLKLLLQTAKESLMPDLLADYITAFKDLEYSEYLAKTPAIGFK